MPKERVSQNICLWKFLFSILFRYTAGSEVKHFLRTHVMVKPRCLFSQGADQIELTTNSLISMMANRLINAGYNQWNRVCWNWPPRKAVSTVRSLAEWGSCRGFSVFMEHWGEKGWENVSACSVKLLLSTLCVILLHGSYARTWGLSAVLWIWCQKNVWSSWWSYTIPSIRQQNYNAHLCVPFALDSWKLKAELVNYIIVLGS